ncbi:4'-phosphopantetheinyl transferase superfamily protein [Neolewinella litorea]|uniref:4'-phosphopantetheinyl transferase superfamily protein n=1 Tax=Neolewinella litorea TaxID=2562452 RepID=A0A4S4N702_9BACT|nr:4'-phosphopantetheinyl transferase superfamily protein [Neolewinella litorea]
MFHIRNDVRLPEQEWTRRCRTLPKEIQRDLNRYRRWQDRQAGLLGKLLLRYAAKKIDAALPELSTLATGAYRRPYFPYRPDFDFNISHTDGLVVCCSAVGMGRLGVDVERVGEVDLGEFRRVFTAEEYAQLQSSPDQVTDFYRLWTRKEAVMKADGRGFSLDPADINCLPERIGVDGTHYTVRELHLRPGYAAHLAARTLPEVTVHEVSLAELH